MVKTVILARAKGYFSKLIEDQLKRIERNKRRVPYLNDAN